MLLGWILTGAALGALIVVSLIQIGNVDAVIQNVDVRLQTETGHED